MTAENQGLLDGIRFIVVEAIKPLAERVNGLAERVDGLAERVDAFSSRVDGLTERMDRLEHEQREQRQLLNDVVLRLDLLERGLLRVDANLQNIEARVLAVESHAARIFSDRMDIFERLSRLDEQVASGFAAYKSDLRMFFRDMRALQSEQERADKAANGIHEEIRLIKQRLDTLETAIGAR